MADYNSSLPVIPGFDAPQFPVEIKDNTNASLIGQKAMAGSIPVVLPSDQSAIPVKTQDGSGNALTSTGGALDVNLKTNAVVGQDVMADSLPVAIASDQSAIPVKTQDGSGNAIGSIQGGLKTVLIDDDDGSALKGQKTMAESVPVTIASNQSTMNVNVVSSAAVTPVHVSHEGVDIAPSETVPSAQTYLVATADLLLKQVNASSAGKMKVVVLNGATVLATAFNSTANPTIDLIFEEPIKIVVGNTLTVNKYNLDKDDTSLYSFINGSKV